VLDRGWFGWFGCVVDGWLHGNGSYLALQSSLRVRARHLDSSIWRIDNHDGCLRVRFFGVTDQSH
jgi:hypothetical protein